MGVASILVEDKIHLGALREGLEEFSEKSCDASEKNNRRWLKLSQNPNSFETDRSRLNPFVLACMLVWNLRLWL